ncbi:uncharacterized protein LOC119383870 isoform X2 [Rhipicephalus sanguineus]|uniref:uncharacterized protein LOC119383870 isoform X2 n=1 Tax=Rhipicephalus sanguineus TaxID=34632 RepID=UPI0020C44CFA|nr:uncharacterized protein LOC119383870 isoform X2 [Rhipicephalus sanguineus]
MHYSQFAILLLASCAFAHTVNQGDLYNALNTNETIWLKQRSYPRNTSCVAEKMVFLNYTDYQFTQSFLNGTQHQNQTLFAKLHNATQGGNPYMTVSQVQGTSGINYTLDYWNDTEKCGVLTMTLGGNKLCEMHVWNSTIGQPLTECQAGYRGLCNGTSYQVYSSNCTTTDA